MRCRAAGRSPSSCETSSSTRSAWRRTRACNRATTSRCRSPTPARAWTRKRCRGSSSRSSRRRRAARGRGWGWPRCTASCSRTTAPSRCTAASGHGTTFYIYLPRATDLGKPAPMPVASPAAGNETILLVEDDDRVRALVSNMLRKNGFTVLLASAGDQALEIAARHRGRIHLLLTDVLMPGLNGRMLVGAAHRDAPGDARALHVGILRRRHPAARREEERRALHSEALLRRRARAQNSRDAQLAGEHPDSHLTSSVAGREQSW